MAGYVASLHRHAKCSTAAMTTEKRQVKPIPGDEVIAVCARRALLAALTVRDRLRFPPGSALDLDEIWEYIADDSLTAPTRLSGYPG